MEVYGIDMDAHTRCIHYNTSLDVVAIKFKCCGKYFACFECHEAMADHPAEKYDALTMKAILCGVCGFEMTILEYQRCESKCPECSFAFNPGCKEHWDHYFF